MDSRLAVGEEYFLKGDVTGKFLGTKGGKNYFYSQDYGVYVISLTSKTQRIGDRIKLIEGSKYVTQRPDFLPSGDRRNIIELTGGLEEVVEMTSAN